MNKKQSCFRYDAQGLFTIKEGTKMDVKIEGISNKELARQMESLHEQIDLAMQGSPLSPENKIAVLMRFNLAIMWSSRGNYVEMELSDGSKVSLKLERPRPLAH